MDVDIWRYQAYVSSRRSSGAPCSYSLLHRRELPLQTSNGTNTYVTAMLASEFGTFGCKFKHFLLAKHTRSMGIGSMTIAPLPSFKKY